MSGFVDLHREVINRGLCTDCGTCASVCPRAVITMNYETEEPDLTGTCAPKCRLCYDACPGQDIDMPGLNRSVFGRLPDAAEPHLGVARAYLKAYAVADPVRQAGAAGGVVSALLVWALETGHISAAVVAGMKEAEPWRVEPKVVRDRAGVVLNAQSRYQVAPINEVMGRICKSPGERVAAVGLPCHVHGLRKIQAMDAPKSIAGGVAFSIGIFCGVNAPHRCTEHIIEELCGVPLAQVAKVEFRGGDYPGRFQVTTLDGQLVPAPMFSTGFTAQGFYKDRCLMCRDYAAELADLSVGDYYHPEMKKGVRGWSAIVVRSETGQEIVDAACADGYLHAEPMAPSYLLGTGFEMKHHGAVLRLLERGRHGWPVPDYHLPLEYPSPLLREVGTRPPYATPE